MGAEKLKEEENGKMTKCINMKERHTLESG